MNEHTRDGIDLDANEDLARALFAWDVEEHDDPAPTWDELTEDQRDVWRSAVDAVIAAGWVSPAVVAERDAEIERLRDPLRPPLADDDSKATWTTGWTSFDSMSRKSAITTCHALVDMRDRAIRRFEGAEAERDKARAVLGEVAALVDKWEGAWASPTRVSDLRAVLAPVSGAVEEAACVRVEAEVGHEDEGPSCVTHNDAWGECRPNPVAVYEQENDGALKEWDLSADEVTSVREAMIDGGAWQLIELTSDTSDRSPSPETVEAARDDIRAWVAAHEQREKGYRYPEAEVHAVCDVLMASMVDEQYGNAGGYVLRDDPRNLAQALMDHFAGREQEVRADDLLRYLLNDARRIDRYGQTPSNELSGMAQEFWASHPLAYLGDFPRPIERVVEWLEAALAARTSGVTGDSNPDSHEWLGDQR